MDTREIKARLPKTWPIFFSRFGKLLPVQIETIPRVLEGRSVIVGSPTASGKTEAVVAPICERLAGDGVRAVYVAPTRALVNDLDARLAEPLRELGIEMAVKTGDRPQFNRKRPAQFVITTPESLDSILSRSTGLLDELDFLIIDEIHLLDATARGDQLRVLTRRLRPGVQYAALSATVSTPGATAARYFSPFETVTVQGAREIEFTLLAEAEIATLRAQFLERGIRKAIFFCNSRRETEALTGVLREMLPADKVHTHHGSLSRPERESVERAMREDRMGFAAATMTLEFGIDIGDVDAIVLYGAPPSVSSLLQRLGRGNRRTGRCTGFAIHRDPIDRDLMVRLLDAALKGEVEEKRYVPHLSVVVQQIFSMAFRGEIRREALRALCTERELEKIISHLSGEGWLTADGRMTEKLADLAEKGEIHSNVESSGLWQVIDISTLQAIGDAPLGHESGRLVLGGRAWVVVKSDARERRLYVKPADGGKTGKFPKRDNLGRFFSFLPEDLREKERMSHG